MKGIKHGYCLLVSCTIDRKVISLDLLDVNDQLDKKSERERYDEMLIRQRNNEKCKNNT